MSLTWRDKKWWFKRALDLVIMVLVVVLATQLFGSLRAPSLPEQAPEFTLRNIDGGVVSLADYRGKMVVLNFWATWCGPCRFEAPAFARFAAKNPNIAVIGIAQDNSVALLKKAREELGINYTIAMADKDVMTKYAISSFPTTVVVDENGKVLTAHAGIMLDPQLAWATRDRD